MLAVPDSTCSLTSFGLSEVTRCGSRLRAIGGDAATMEAAADRMVRCLRDRFVDPSTGQKSMALVRFYKTHPFGELDEDSREFARRMLGDTPESSDMKCLTLLASVGDLPEWSSRTTSAGHRAIPLPSVQFIERFPMIAQLIRQFGLSIESVIEPTDELLIDADQHSYNVFYVPEAVGSASIPAQQDFVVPFGIQSVVGLGGTLPTGDLFALILFSKTHVPRETAALFRTLSLSVRMAVLPVCDTAQTFGGDGAERAESPAVDYSGAMVASAEKLLDLHERMVIEQSALAESRNRELAHLASTDALTGVDNRREFTERLDAEHQRAVRGKTTLGLIMIDIDHFKGYNDRLGHPAGDECLRAIATALTGCINRSTDAIARYGGEEFVAVLPATDPEGVAHLAETMRAAVETLAIPHPQSVSPVVTISLGVVTSNPSVDSAAETLVRIADGALFQAKDGGRNRVVVAADA